MKTPAKAKSNPRNQSPEFNEALSAALPAPAAVGAQPGLSSRQIRWGLGIIWVAAALLAGVGLGRLIHQSRLATLGEAPAPVATARVSVTPLSAVKTAAIAPASPAVTGALAVAPASGITQAQAGTPLSTLSAADFQPADGSDALQPGFTHFGHSQGNIGTDPVR